jgi:RNA polymerase sigma-70 factor (ECF subfamily)
LPDSKRFIFNLFAYEGYSHKEIAKKLNISVMTSKGQLSKAKKLLQERLIKLNISHYENIRES